MTLLHPFQAYSANKDHYQHIIAPPYDVLTRSQANRIAKQSLANILHVTRPDADYDNTVSFDDPLCYQHAKQSLDKLLNDNYFTMQPNCYLIYRINKDSHCQTGIAGMLSLNKNTLSCLKKHEHTKPKKVSDRAKLLTTLEKQISPVLLTIRSPSDLKATLQEICQCFDISYQAIDDNGYQHQIWQLSPSQTTQVKHLLAPINQYYIADGHHRCAAALAAQNQSQQKQILSVVFPEDELQILGYHRLVKDSGLKDNQLLNSLRKTFSIQPIDAVYLPATAASFGLYCNKQWYRLDSHHPQLLDVDTLHQQIIEPLFGINNPREDERIDFIGGNDASNAIENLVNDNIFQFAFTLPPTSINDILSVADANRVMPPKSTWFEPKLLDGFFMG